MKYTILLLSTFLFLQVSEGQIKKGTILVDASVSYSRTTTEQEIPINGPYLMTEQKTSSFGISPSIGFFASSTVAVGVGIRHSYQHATFNTSLFGADPVLGYQKINLSSFDTYVQKYIRIKDKIYFTISAYASVGLGKGKYSASETQTKIFEFSLNTYPGATYFVSPNWAVYTNFALFGYTFRREKLKPGPHVDEDSKNIAEDLRMSFQANTFGVGVQYFLRNKAE
jgi:hypothetical protein